MRIRIEHIYILAFIIVAYILLPVMNADYLFTIQENNVFISGHTFMMDIVKNEGGWVAWVACYLTQFFYHPWLGSTILIAFWVAIYVLTLHLFGIKDKFSPIALILPTILLFNLLDYGYWIYYVHTPGFPFQPTLIVLFILLCASLTHPFFRRTKHGKFLSNALPFELCIIFLAVCTLTIWKPEKKNILNNHQSAILTTLKDKNFKHEMRMYRAIDESRYEDALSEMKDLKEPPTNLMALMKNVALMHTGRLTEMFKTNNCGIMPETGDSLHLHISQLAAPLIYYQFGQINYAYRWAMGNSVKYGQSFRNLKMMIRYAIFNQEFDLAAKYLSMLKTSIYYKDWAKEREAWLTSSTLFIQSKEFQNIAPLVNDEANSLDYDEGLCEKYLLEHFSNQLNPNSSKQEDVIICCSLWNKDAYAFCVHFYDYVQAHPTQAIPELYQEAAILLGNAEDSPITLNNFKFDTLVSDKYNNFVNNYNQLLQQGIDEAEMARRLKPLYGDTYWWYYYFYTDFNIY